MITFISSNIQNPNQSNRLQAWTPLSIKEKSILPQEKSNAKIDKTSIKVLFNNKFIANTQSNYDPLYKPCIKIFHHPSNQQNKQTNSTFFRYYQDVRNVNSNNSSQLKGIISQKSDIQFNVKKNSKHLIEAPQSRENEIINERKYLLPSMRSNSVQYETKSQISNETQKFNDSRFLLPHDRKNIQQGMSKQQNNRNLK